MTHRLTQDNVRVYQQIYNNFLELAGAQAAATAKRKFGYERLQELTTKGQQLLIHKNILDCKNQHAPLTTSILKCSEKMKVNPMWILALPTKDIQKEVTRPRKELWTTQKSSAEARMEWLHQIAQDRSRAEGNPDWEAKMKQMLKDAQERSINRKLTAATKGVYGPLDTIQIPTHEWFLSPQQNELYQYEHGSFKAYPADSIISTFYTYHTLKVLPTDAVLVDVELDSTNGRYHSKSILPKPEHTWRDVTIPSEMEITLLTQNKRHLQQTVIKGGTSNSQPMKLFREEMGLGSAANTLLQGTLQIKFEVGSAVTAWINAVRQTDEIQSIPPVIGSLSTTKFQEMFKKKHEATSINPHGMNYTIWKAMAKSKHLTSFLSILVSLSFIYGFVNTIWMNMIDVMLEKKPGVRTYTCSGSLGYFAQNSTLHSVISSDTRASKTSRTHPPLVTNSTDPANTDKQ